MKSLSDQYLELAALVRNHLTEEFRPDERLFVEAESYVFFRQQAQQQMQQQKKPNAPLPSPAAKISASPSYSPPPPPVVKSTPPVQTAVAAPKPLPKKEPAEPAKVEEERAKPFFVLEPMAKAAVVDLGAVGKTFETLFPQLYVNEVPKFKAESHLTFFIINMETVAERRAFLNQLGRALFTLFGQVKMISADQLAGAEGIVVAPRSLEEQVKGHSGKIVYLDEIDLYLKEPTRKAVLWEAIQSVCTQ